MPLPRILLVEDDPVAQDLIASLLAVQGWKVDVASDGFTSLKLLRDYAYQVALIDYHLPEMDGYALARLMRDSCSGRAERLQLIAMTADHHGLTARRGADRLFDDVLAKPFQPHDLAAKLAGRLPAGSDPRRLTAAAAALLERPDVDQARNLAGAIWRARGLSDLPKARLMPAPTVDQTAAVRICFDIVEDDPDLVVILDARGLQELLRTRLVTSPHLPTVALDRDLAMVTDAHFDVTESASWSSIARLIRESSGRARAAS